MALSTSPSQTVSLWPPTPTPALMDSGAKMESLSNLGSGAVGRKETWSRERQRQDGAREAGGAHAGAKQPKETERQPGATQGNKSCARRTQKQARAHQVRARVSGQCVLF